MLTVNTFSLVWTPKVNESGVPTIYKTSGDINEVNALFNSKFRGVPGMSIQRHVKPVQVFTLNELTERTFEDDSVDGICHACHEHSSPVYYLDDNDQIDDGPESSCCGAGIDIF